MTRPATNETRGLAAAQPSAAGRLAACLLLAAAALLAPASAVAQPRPVIERIEPTSGPPGTEIQIIGRHLHPQSRLLLGAAELLVVRRMPNRWTVRVPDGAATGAMSIQTRWGVFPGPRFTVTAARGAPVVERLEPAVAQPGAEITLHGQNFSPRLSDNAVTLGGRAVVVRSVTPTTLVVVVPPGAATGPFRVVVAQGGTVESPPLEVAVGTAITSFTPRVGPPGTTVVLTGTGFSARARDNRVYMNGRPARVVRATPTSLEIRIPNTQATGALLLDVRGGGRAESSTPFTIQYPPVVRAIVPAAAPPGATVKLRGEHFGSDLRVVRAAIGGVALRIRGVTPTEIEVEVPQGAASGRVEVTVGELGPAASPGELRVLVPLAISAFEPRSGGPGSEIVIRGQGFSTQPTDNQVLLSGAGAQVIAATATELRVRVPSAPSGVLLVRVADNGEVRTTAPFVVTQPPFIASFESASASPGGELVIRGTHFGTNAALVTVRLGALVLPIRSIADERLVVSVPAGAVTGRVTVAVRLQGAATSSSDVTIVPPLAVTAVSPGAGYVGTSVVVRGASFAEGATVTFPGAPPQRPLTTAAGELRVVVPAGAQTGTLTVTLPDGRAATSSRSFAVEATPDGLAIGSVEALCARPGCHVIIRGHGFSARARANRVFLGGRPARVNRASATELDVTIPNITGAQAFRIDVQGGGRVESTPITVASP